MSDLSVKLAAWTVLGFLVAILVAVHRPKRSTPARLWVVAGSLILLRGLVQLFGPDFGASSWLVQSLDWGLAELAGITFLVSVSEVAEQPRPRRVLLVILAVPLLTYTLASLAGWRLPWLYLAAVVVLVYGSAAFVLISRRDLTVYVLALLAALALLGPWMIYGVLVGKVQEPLQGALAALFALAGALFWRRYRRLTPGVLTVLVGLLAWATAFAVALTVQLSLRIAWWPQELWSVPVFLVAIGMIVTLMEDQTRGQRMLEAQLRSANLELQELSLNDALTKIHNRRYFYLNVERDVSQALRSHGEPVKSVFPPYDLIFFVVDIDHFKRVNDTLGHAVGDKLLVEVAARLSAVVRQSDMLVRWGGEEFLVVSACADRHDAQVLSRRILDAIGARPCHLDNAVVHVTCSVGWAPFPWFGRSPRLINYKQVLELADRALYAAKESGRNRAVGLIPESDTVPAEARESQESFMELDSLALQQVCVFSPGSARLTTQDTR